MKKTILLLSISAALSCGKIKAQTIYQVTRGTAQSFRKDFANAEDVCWSSLKGTEIALFKRYDQQLLAWYSSGSELIAVGKSITFNQVPAIVQNVFTQSFKNLTMHEIFEVYSPGQGTCYFIRAENENRKLYIEINAAGNHQIIRKVKK